MELVSEEHSIQQCSLDQLLAKQSSRQKDLYEAFQEKTFASDVSVEAILENLSTIKNDFLALRDQLKHVMHSPAQSAIIKELSPSNEVVVPSQTEGILIDGFTQHEQVISSYSLSISI